MVFILFFQIINGNHLNNNYIFISILTPAGISSFSKLVNVVAVGYNISITLLCVLISNCSLESLCLCGERITVTTSFLVGSGIGPETCAPVFLAVSTIFSAD